ncbi:two-component system sensor histidine kinase NtrB [Desulfofalx alkaliphila]|uniref:two-component system sensor histidine kinase NtrB n=1 Tax=Desulfofalx alkaliphila TaxID=105483 RepID=UPI00068CF1A9|nr:ATP-binding protein [Desulfofalx alkaliphila]
MVLRKNNEQLYLALLKGINTGLIVIDAQGHIVLVNRYCEEMLGISFSDVAGMHYAEALKHIPPEERYTLLTLETGIEYKDVGYEEKRLNRRHIITDTLLLRDNDNRIVGAAGIFKDVTMVKELETKVQQMKHLSMMGEMAAGMAHEIRNPLASIKGFMQLLEEKGYYSIPEESGTDYLSIINKEIDRLNQLVDRFLLLSKSCFAKRRLDLNQVIKDVILLVSKQTKDAGIKLTVELCERAVVLGDEQSLKQVFLNMINNSIDALAGGGEIRISSEILDHQYLLVTLADNGMGVKPELIDELFKPFYTTKSNGTGLGLLISKKIITNHRGEIKVVSEYGKGIKFIIKLPRYEQSS